MDRRRRGGALARAALLALAVMLAAAPPARAAGDAHAPARRIVSLNLCVDVILPDLVEAGRIRALSWLASDPNVSPIVARARAFKSVRGHAEEVLALAPDLVLAGTWTTPATVDLLRRLGLRVELVPLAATFEEIRAIVRTIAAAVGERERGEALVADFDRRLAAGTPAGGPRPSALVYQVGNLVSGPGTLTDAVLARAGLANHAARTRLGPAGRLSLEQIVADPPDLLVLAQAAATYRTTIADNLRHPALAALARRVPVRALDMPAWICGAPQVADAVAALAAMRPGLAVRERAQ